MIVVTLACMIVIGYPLWTMWQLRTGRANVVEFAQGDYGIRRWDAGRWAFLSQSPHSGDYHWWSKAHIDMWQRFPYESAAREFLVAWKAHELRGRDTGRKV